MSNPRVQLEHSLIRTTSKILKKSKHHLDQYQLSGAEYGIIQALGDCTLTLSELSQKLLKVNSNITTIVDHLEERGLVQRIRDEVDRRVVKVQLTPAGLQLRERVLPEHYGFVTELLLPLTDDEVQKMLDLLERVETICDNNQ